MSNIKLSSITNKAKTSGPTIAATTSSTSTGYARLASGTNEERVSIEEGSIRYNETAKLLEFYDGTQWNFIIPAEESANALGVFAGGYVGNDTTYYYLNTIDYITISTTGNAQEFGELIRANAYMGGSGCSSTTRGVYGTDGGSLSVEYLTMSSKGNASIFGTLSSNKGSAGVCSSKTRGIYAGGNTSNTIDYITIATTGNATNFGGILTQSRWHIASFASSTRGYFCQGRIGGAPTYPSVNIIDYITIASTGVNASDFGDSLTTDATTYGCSSSTRGIWTGNYITIQYINLTTSGNGIYFGTLNQKRYHTNGSCSSSTRGVFGGGTVYDPYDVVNNIDYVTIATTGNAEYFGDLSVKKGEGGAVSNNHGGLL